jgi:hypothetical protein
VNHHDDVVREDFQKQLVHLRRSGNLPELHVAYMEILNEELAPYALNLALRSPSLKMPMPRSDGTTNDGDTCSAIPDRWYVLPPLRFGVEAVG